MTPPLDRLNLIVPSRGRPGNADAFVEAFDGTASMASSQWHLSIDSDDAVGHEYLTVEREQHEHWGGTTRGPNTTMNQALNAAAKIIVFTERYSVIGFAGDDHRLRTPGWDLLIHEALINLGTGIVYGNDLFQGRNLPTAVFMTVDIVKALGYMAPPCLAHLELDTFWLDLGQRLQMIRYLDNVVIEHMHPEAGKAEYDDGYARMNSQRGRDLVAYEQYKESGRFLEDVEKVRAIQVVR